MPNVKISAAADAGTLLSNDMLPLARSGDTNAYHCTMAEISTYTTASVASGAYGNVGRNLLHNAMFNVQQRGVGPFGAAGYTADRWYLDFNLDTGVSATVNVAADNIRALVGDEAVASYFMYQTTGNAGAAAYTRVLQRLENVRRLGGKTVTVSFWAWAASGAPNLGVGWDQIFGSGGSPSAPVSGAGQRVTLSTTPARYSLTFALNSTAGMTLGTTAGTDYTQFAFWLSAGSNFAARSGSVGVQTTNVALWGIQLEIGSTATPLEKLDIADDLRHCQRFYNGFLQFQVNGYATAGVGAGLAVNHPVTMRAPPSLVIINNNSINVVPSLNPQNAWSSAASGPVTATGGYVFNISVQASADL